MSLCVDNEVELRLMVDTTLDGAGALVLLSGEIYEGSYCGEERMNTISAESPTRLFSGDTMWWSASLETNEVGADSSGDYLVRVEYLQD